MSNIDLQNIPTGILTEIASAIKDRKNTASKISGKDFVTQILSINNLSDYYSLVDLTKPSEDSDILIRFFSDVADAIRIKKGIDGNIKPKDMPEEIRNLKLSLSKPEICFYIGPDPLLDDITSTIPLHIYTSNARLTNNAPSLIDLDNLQLPINIEFTAADCYKFDDNSSGICTNGIGYDTGDIEYTWTMSESKDHAILSITKLDGPISDLDINVEGIQYKLKAPSIALHSTIRFETSDGHVLRETLVPHDAMPLYLRKLPADNDQYLYNIFVRWYPSLQNVTGDATYKAKITGTDSELFEITWKIGDTSIIVSDVPVGSIPTYNGRLPEQEYNRFYHYRFDGWYSNNEDMIGIFPVAQDAVYEAIFNEYPNVVKLLNNDGGYTYEIYSKVTPEYTESGLVYNITDVEEVKQ